MRLPKFSLPDDHKLAATKYAGRMSATDEAKAKKKAAEDKAAAKKAAAEDKKAAKARIGRQIGVRGEAAKGQKWEDLNRRGLA